MRHVTACLRHGCERWCQFRGGQRSVLAKKCDSCVGDWRGGTTPAAFYSRGGRVMGECVRSSEIERYSRHSDKSKTSRITQWRHTVGPWFPEEGFRMSEKEPRRVVSCIGVVFAMQSGVCGVAREREYFRNRVERSQTFDGKSRVPCAWAADTYTFPRHCEALPPCTRSSCQPINMFASQHAWKRR